jgi:hypothetical protein
MSEGSDVEGNGGRGVGRGAGRGTADDSAVGVRNGSSVDLGIVAAGGRDDSLGPGELDGFKPSSFDLGGVAEGLGVLTGSAFSIRFGFGVSFSESAFFFGEGDFSSSALGLFFVAGLFVGSGVSVAFAFGFGATSSSSSPVFLPGDFAFGFGVGDSSSSSSELFFGRGVFVGSGVSVGFVFAFGFGVGVGFFLDFDFRLAGFGLAVDSGVSEGVGEVTARISSRALRASRFFFSSSVSCA